LAIFFQLLHKKGFLNYKFGKLVSKHFLDLFIYKDLIPWEGMVMQKPKKLKEKEDLFKRISESGLIVSRKSDAHKVKPLAIPITN